MACNSKQNTLRHLKEIGVLDENGRINDISRLDKINQTYTKHMQENLGITTSELLLPYREVKRTDVSGHNRFFYVLEPNTALFNQIDEVVNAQVTEDLYEPIDFFEDLYAPNSTVPTTPKYEKYIQYKNNLLRRLQSRLSKIRADKKKYSSDPVQLKNLTALENVIETRINGSSELDVKGLIEEIAELAQAPAIDKLAFYAEKDFDRLDSLVNSIDPQDLQEARVIINFYKTLGSFDNSDSHPFFNIEEVLDDKGQVTLPQETVDLLSTLMEKAISYGNVIYQREKQAIVANVNNNSKVQALYDKTFTHEELFYKETGLKDAPWVDMFLMDITNGIFSTNGIIPQVMMNNIQNAFESNLVYAKTVETRLNDMQKEVEAELKALGYDLAGTAGIFGLKGVSYDLFKAEDKNGQFKDSIVQRYDASYIEARNRMFYEFNQAFVRARAIADPLKKQQAINRAYDKRNKWYKKNTVVLDIRKMPEIADRSDMTFDQSTQDAYRQELVDILGEQGYLEELSKQQKLMKDYETRLEVFKEGVIAEGGTPAEQNKKIQKWTKRNDPFVTVDSYYTGDPISIGKLIYQPTMTYNYSIPRKKKVKLKSTAQGIAIEPTNINTNFYDKKFETIEASPKLKEFHTLLMEVQTKMFDIMPEEVRRKFSANSLPTLEKNLIEILTDPNTALFKKLSSAARFLYDRIRAMFGINIQNSLSYANVDPITGKPEYKVNDQFLKSNKTEIDQRYQVELLRLKQALGIPLTQSITKYDTFNIMNNPAAIALLAENLNVDATLAAVQAKLSGEHLQALEVGKVLRGAITHQVVQEKSFDLPKILKLYSYMTMEYAARQEVLPLMTMMKNHYEEIQDPARTNTGASVVNVASGETRLEGARVNAVKQMNSWFERVVLGDYGSKNEFDNTTLKRHINVGLTQLEGKNKFASALSTTITGRILNTNEKILQKKIPGLLEELEAIMTKPGVTEEEMAQAQAAYNRLQKLEENLGKRFSATAMFDALFNFIRFKGLGWNLSSYITNFMEGQIANMTVAATGDYFTPENIYRANNIVKGSFIKNLSFGKVATPGAKLTRILMDRYRILQDASNELQKASSKSNFSKLKDLDPYEGTRRTEYLNQAPLMISILMDQMITGIDGTTQSNVWDAMNSDGTLKDEFATEENKKNWEDANGGVYNDFASKIKKTIVNAHGDYDELRGNMASERLSGKALLMFKRWMARQFYQRFAMVPQADLEVGIKEYKGRYLSHTKSTGFLHGAIIGFGGFGLLGAGPLGLILGGAAGYVAAQGFGANTGMNFLKELAFTSKELFLTLMKIPVNNLTGKPTIKDLGTKTLYGKMNLPSSYSDLNLGERDVRNLKANLVDMAVTLAWMGMLLFTKALLWSDDDDSDDGRRKAHNFLANRFMQLAGQATMYSNPVEIGRSTVGSIPILKFFGDVGKLATEATDFLEGKDTLAGGANAGESAFYKQLKRTLFPGIIKDSSLGFDTQMQKQFRPHAFDTWFHSDEKKTKKLTQGMRAAYQRELLDQGMSKTDAKKLVKKKYRFKKKGESYQDLLKEYKSIE